MAIVVENRNQILIVILAIAAGIGAVILAKTAMQKEIEQKTQVLSQEYETKQTELAARMQAENKENLETLRRQMEESRQKEAENLQKQLAAVQAQMAVQKSAKAEKEKIRKPSLALRTPQGKRAVTIMIDSLNAVGGLLNAGDVVDVIANLSIPDKNVVAQKDGKEVKKDTVTAMIFQNVQVLAVNTNLDDPGAYDDQQALAALKVTVAVDPQEAGLLAFASKNGKLELALRSPDEKDKQMVKASTWKTLADYVLENQGADLTNPDGIKKEDKPVENKPSIQIFRGGKEL